MNLDEVLDKHDELRRRNSGKEPLLQEQTFFWKRGEDRTIRLRVIRTSPLDAPVDEFEYEISYLAVGRDEIPGSGRVDAQMTTRYVLDALLRDADDNWPKY